MLLSDANYKVTQSTQSATKEQEKQAEQAQALAEKNERLAIQEQIAAIKNLNNINKKKAAEADLRLKQESYGDAYIAMLKKQAAAEEEAARKATASYQIMARAKNMAYRFLPLLGEIAVLGLLFESLDKVKTAELESIPGTDAFTAKQEKMTQATNSLADAFKNYTEEMIKARDAQRTVFDGINGGEEAAKRWEAALKAAGVTNGEIFNAESLQAEARKQTLQEELKGLKQKDDIINGNLKLFNSLNKDAQEYIGNPDVINNSVGHDPEKNKNVQAVLYSRAKAGIESADVPADQKKDLLAQIDKSYKEDGNMIEVYRKVLRDLQVQSVNSGNSISNANADYANVDRELQAKINDRKYQKEQSLKSSKDSFDEQQRLALLLGSPQGIDDAVETVRAKYRELLDGMKQDRDNYIKSVGGEDEHSREIDRRIGIISNIIAPAAEGQAAADFTRNKIQQERAGAIAIANNNASSSAFSAAFGVPNYDKLKDALDKETEAKKLAITNQFENQRRAAGDNAGQIIELEKQQNTALEQIDQDSYRKRLGLATEYFKRSVELVNANSDILASEESARHYSTLTDILNNGGSSNEKDYKAFMEGQQTRINLANIEKQRISKDLPAAQTAFTTADNATKGPLSKDAIEEAERNKVIAQKNLQDLVTAEKQADSEIADATDQMNRKKLEGLQDLKEKSIQLVQETIDAIATIQDNQFAAEQQQIQIKQQALELQTQQQLQAIDATSGFQITKDNEKSKVAAQAAAEENTLQAQSNALALKKAKADKEAAELKIISSTATAIVEVIAAYAGIPGGFARAAGLSGVIAGIGAAQYAAAASAPLPQYRDGTPPSKHPGGLAVVGDGGAKELITMPTGEAFWSKAEPTVIDLPKGAEVVPLHKMYDYATSRVVSMGRVNPALLASYSNDEAIHKIAKMIASEYKAGSGDIVDAIWGSRQHVPDPGAAYERALRMQSRLNINK